MIARQSIALLLTFVWLGQDVCLAGRKFPQIPKNGRLSWIELGPIAVDRKARVSLTDRTRLHGQVLAVRPESLVLEITRTSDKNAWPKGQAEIPRTAVQEFRLVKDSGPMKLVGGILGTLGGLMAASYITVYHAGAAYPAFFLLMPAVAVAGYYAGKAADVRTKLITIVPDAAQVEE